MKELMLFNNEEFGNVRMVEIDGKAYAVGKDIATILGYKNTNDAISKHCKGVVKHEGFTINGSQIALIPQSDIIRLVVKCPLDGADKIENWIFEEVIPCVLNTGRYDQLEQKIMKIEDEVERNLRLTIHQYESIVKINSTDILSAMMLNNKRNELNTYLQQKQINDIKGKLEETEKRINNIYVIGDRKQFTNEVNSVCRSTGMEQSRVYGLVYKQLLDDYGIDLPTRVENKKRKIQEERLNSGKKPLSPATLKQKATCLNIADEENLWNELGKCLFAVKDKYLVK